MGSAGALGLFRWGSGFGRGRRSRWGGLPAVRGEGLRGNRGGTGVEIVTSRRVAAGTARDVRGRPARRGKFGARLFLTLEQKQTNKKNRYFLSPSPPPLFYRNSFSVRVAGALSRQRSADAA